MSRLNWDLVKEYEAGIDRGVLYSTDGIAETWNGLVSVTEKNESSERVRYIDGRTIVNHRREEFSAVVTAFTQPSSFVQYPRSMFGLSYRSLTATSYRIHLVYNALGKRREQAHDQSENPSPISIDISTLPVEIPEAIPTAHLIVEAANAYPEVLLQLEDIIYGAESENARLPSAVEVFELFDSNAVFKIIDNGDGTFTMDAPDSSFNWLSVTEVQVEWPRVSYLDEDRYRIRSW